MDAWPAVITDHTNSNAPLQTGWAGSVWPRAAEIIKYTCAAWPHANRFATMLRNVYLPEVRNGSNNNGNQHPEPHPPATPGGDQQPVRGLGTLTHGDNPA